MRTVALPRRAVGIGLCIALLSLVGADSQRRSPAGPEWPTWWVPIVSGDLTYTDGRLLDVYRPPGDSSNLPVVLMIHGCCGDRADLGHLPPAIAMAGAVVYNADWSGVKPGVTYRQAYAEVACAVGYARSTATRYGGDPRRVTLFGWSDGAMAAAVVAAGGLSLSDPGCRSKRGPDRPDGLVGVAGYYGWTLPPEANLESDRAVAFVGGTHDEVPVAWEEATPHGWLAAAGPRCATLIVGATDPLAADARRYAAALRSSGHAVRLVVAPPSGDQSMLSIRTVEGRTTVRETVATADRCRNTNIARSWGRSG
jgi:acetyl esterase/lipase